MDALVLAVTALTTTVATNAAAAMVAVVAAAAAAASIRAGASFQLTYKYVNFARALSVASGYSRT